MNALTLESVGKELFIDGAWRPASDGARLAIVDPAKEEKIPSVADASVDDAREALDCAHRAGPAWAAAPPRQRGETLRRAFELMTGRKEEIARLITLENGKALSEARAEVAYAAEFLRWFSEEAVRALGEVSTAPSGANRILVLRQPIGPALFVTPWNFPAAMAARKIGPALAAGCTMILKPAKETPLTALAMAAVFQEAGVPPGVVNVLPSRRSSAIVSALLKDDRLRKLSFTGSTETGRVLLAQAAQKVVKCSMELGGNAPFVVFADADLDAAVSSALVAKMRNVGQSCVAANRFYVERPVAHEFAQRFAKAMGSMKLGHGLDEGVEVGPLIDQPTRAKVAELVTEALDRGARALIGAKAPQRRGFFYEPTVLTGVGDDFAVTRNEIFGPVAPIVEFDTEEEALAMANGTEFGLVAYVHTRDLARGLRVSERIEAGMVGVNRGLVSDPAAPFGGWKQSGLGREGAHDGLLEFLETKYIAANW
ncbi:MAG: NAD-dependent succinate-semialdehyde dehydrogenase [Burkholderiales bacterium]|nr:NAD-dependent succinate-semialdehyde dehydrogenase [Burkholderiales bacterium]